MDAVLDGSRASNELNRGEWPTGPWYKYHSEIESWSTAPCLFPYVSLWMGAFCPASQRRSSRDNDRRELPFPSQPRWSRDPFQRVWLESSNIQWLIRSAIFCGAAPRSDVDGEYFPRGIRKSSPTVEACHKQRGIMRGSGSWGRSSSSVKVQLWP